MTINWTTTSQSNAVQGVKILVWAESGMGKTTLCATAPAPIILSAEKGLLTLNKKNLERLYGVNTPGIAYDIPVMEIKTMKDLEEAYQWLTESPHAAQFSTVCIDSISEIAETVLNNEKRSAKDPRQAYGALLEKMETIVRSFRDLPGKNVYMIAKAEPAKDELTGIVRFGPSMPGSKLGPKLPYFFDEVFKLAVNKDAKGVLFRYLLTQPDLQNTAKDRSGALDPMEPPHLAHIFNKIQSGV